MHNLFEMEIRTGMWKSTLKEVKTWQELSDWEDLRWNLKERVPEVFAGHCDYLGFHQMRPADVHRLPQQAVCYIFYILGKIKKN